jgi:hypothetical protein
MIATRAHKNHKPLIRIHYILFKKTHLFLRRVRSQKIYYEKTVRRLESNQDYNHSTQVKNKQQATLLRRLLATKLQYKKLHFLKYRNTCGHFDCRDAAA